MDYAKEHTKRIIKEIVNEMFKEGEIEIKPIYENNRVTVDVYVNGDLVQENKD